MKYYTNNLLSFDRNPKTTAAIHALFGTLTSMEWQEASFFSMKEKSYVNVVKDPCDIVKVDFDYSELYNEYVNWGFGLPNKILLPIWSLNKEKTGLFLRSLETCVIYYQSRRHLFSPNVMDSVLELYVDIFQKELPEFSLN